ncbi:MAG: hypothetical protein DRN16_00285 [Thermoplasmata archaeon]|nr:MAG: hypothetical protein DRN16_00285 [Thermoplasmata archaeon]
MSIKEKIIAYSRLCRLQATGLIATLSVIGAAVAGQKNPFLLGMVFIIGVFYHIFLYVLNDYVDLEVDKKSKDLQRKPLVSGVIPKQNALILTGAAIIIMYVLTIIFFPYIQALLVLSFAVLLGIIYDCFGKKMPGVADFIMAGSLAATFLFGASTVSNPFSMIIYLTFLIILFFTVYGNAVEGGLKDVDHDYLGGAKTLATIMGVKVEDGRLLMTKKFAFFSWSIEIISFILILLLANQPEINIFRSGDYLKIGVVVFLIIIALISTVMFLTLKKFDRAKMKKLFGVINSSSGALIIILLLPLLDLIKTIILLLLPITWYIIFNTVLYGKPMQPDI